MTEQNKDVKQAIVESGIKKYQIAHAIGVSDAWFSKMLRYELPAEKKTQIFNAIEQLIESEG